MSEHDLRRGLDALADDEVRAKVATGDVVAAGKLELTDEERALLVAAADDEPEVIGHMISVGLGINPATTPDREVLDRVATVGAGPTGTSPVGRPASGRLDERSGE